ncbi:acyltransferase family protein [Aquipseudomonas alcaligenes]|uniref:acyltransferase family protein n=1 Tax=Aquipseudomonas alcaligenes TaxID=43263 RepID=UPI0037491F6B
MKPSHYSYIDALRGYAILLVMAVHASQAAPEITGVGRLLLDQGARGVQLFFVASALTLLLSWNSRDDGVAAFYLRRVFRIAPMFWLGIVFFLCLDGFSPRYFAPNGIDGGDVFLTAVFFHGWHPETITSVVPGGWSIGVEMTFYALFPVLVLLARGWFSTVVLLFSSLVISNFLIFLFVRVLPQAFPLWESIPDYLVKTYLTLWFPNQLPVFVVGFFLYLAIRDFSGKFPLWILNFVFCLVVFVLVLFSIQSSLPVVFKVNSYVIYGACFGVIAYCLSQGAARWLVNLPICYLGRVSFSAYLWHFAVIGVVGKLSVLGFNALDLLVESRGWGFFIQFFVFLVVVTTLFSSLTYRFIERPMVRLGSWLIGNLDASRKIEVDASRAGRSSL